MSNRPHKSGIYWVVFFFVSCFSLSLLAQNFPLGGVAPYGNPDQNLNAADLLILQRMVSGEITPTNNEILLGDVAPIGQGDNTLNVGDLVVLQRAVLGEITLGTINISTLQPPELNVAISPTNDNPYTITGTATPSTLIDIYVQGVAKHQITSQPDGTFSVDVYLIDGFNSIYAAETDGTYSSLASNTLWVQYNNVIDRNNLPTNITVDTVWTAGNAEPYIIASTLIVDAGVSLTLQPGTELKFQSGASLVVNGSLVVSGTAQDNVVFTSNQLSKAIGDWTGISVAASGMVTIDYALIEYAVNGVYFPTGSYGRVSNSIFRYNTDGIEISGATSPVISPNNTITKNVSGIHLLVAGSVNPTAQISQNKILNNITYNIEASRYFVGGIDAIVDVRNNYWGSSFANVITLTMTDPGQYNAPTIDYGGFLDVNGTVISGETLIGTIQEDTTLLANKTYHVLSNIEVATGVTLSIPAGVILKVVKNRLGSFAINVDGTLIVSGSQTEPVVFTAAAKVLIDDVVSIQAHWAGILVRDGGNVILDNAVIEYASTAVHFVSGSGGNIVNSKIINNGSGIDASGDSVNVSKNPSPIITNNSIHNNRWNYKATNYADNKNVRLNATNNWWGTVDVPQILANIYDYDNVPASSPIVDISTILESEGGDPYPYTILLGPLQQDNMILNGTYLIGGNIIIDSNQTLTVAAGSQILSGTIGRFVVNGELIVSGTDQNRVKFTSVETPPVGWGGIRVEDGGNVIIDYATIEYASIGVHFLAGSAGSITNSKLINNSYAIFAEGDGINMAKNPLPIVNYNSIYNSTSKNYKAHNYANNSIVSLNANNNWWGSIDAGVIVSKIEDYQSYPTSAPLVDLTSILDSDAGNVYSYAVLHGPFSQTDTILDGLYTYGETLVVAADQTLTINAGSVLAGATGVGIYVYGSLTATGVGNSKVVFTKNKDQKNAPISGDWLGIFVYSGGSINLDNALVQYASYGVYFDSASGTLTNSVFAENTYGLYLKGNSNPLISSNSIVGNRYGIYLSGYNATDPQPSITNNDIYGSVTYDLFLFYIDPATVLDITGNWWGTKTVSDIRNNIGTYGGSDQTLSVALTNVSRSANQENIPNNFSVSERYISPLTSQNTQDTTTITANFSGTTNWVLEIRDSSGQLVNSFSDSSSLINQSWNGKNALLQDVADGKYIFVVRVGGTDVYYDQGVTVDNTLPVSSFNNVPNGLIINSSNLTVSGIANDMNLSTYLVEYTDDPATGSWTTIEAVKTASVNDGTLVYWAIIDESGVPISAQNGTYTLRLTTTDLAGNINTNNVEIALNTLSLYNVVNDNITINPALGEVSTISFELNAPATVTLQMTDEQSGRVVRSIVQNFISAGPGIMTWNGKDDSDNYVQDEAYLYTLTADDGLQQSIYSPSVTTGTGYVTSSTIVDYNISRNEFWKNNTTMSYTQRIRLCINDGAGAGFSCLLSNSYAETIGTPYEVGEQWIYWDGRDLDGVYNDSSDYNFQWTSTEKLPPNTIIVKGTAPFVHGEGVAPEIEIKSNPYFVQHSYEEFSQIKFQVDQNSTVTAKLLPPGVNDPNATNAIMLIDGQPLVANTIETIIWKGYLDNDTNNILIDEEGLYTFTIEATSDVTGFTTLYRGALTLQH